MRTLHASDVVILFLISGFYTNSHSTLLEYTMPPWMTHPFFMHHFPDAASIFFDASLLSMRSLHASQPAFCQASVLCLPHPKYAHRR